MKLIADECVDLQIVERLRRDGHDVIYISELSPSVTDEVVLHLSNECEAVLITIDKDFGELVFRQNQVHNGVVLIRIHGMDSEAKAEFVSQVIREHAEELVGAFCVVSRSAVRIRRQDCN